MNLNNTRENTYRIMSNKIIINFRAKYIIEIEVNKNKLILINLARLYKKIYLLFKLVRMERGTKIREFKEVTQ